MKRTVTHQAEPTLRGLQVIDASPGSGTCGTLYPWDRVSREPKGSPSTVWAVYTDDGSDVLEHGKRLRLRTRHAWASKLAHRAQLRWFRRAWRGGTLQVEDRYPGRNRGFFWAMALFFLAGGLLSGGYLVTSALLGWHADSRLAIPLRIKGSFFLIAILLGLWYLGICWAAVRLFARMGRYANVVRSHIDSEGIRVTLRNGKVIHGAWSDLKEIRQRFPGLTYLRFASTGDIWLVEGPPARTRLALRIAEEALQPQDPRQAERRFRRMAVLLWELGCVVTLALVAWLDRDWARCLRLLPMFLVPLVLAGGMYLNARLQRYEQRRQRRRDRRRLQFPGHATQR